MRILELSSRTSFTCSPPHGSHDKDNTSNKSPSLQGITVIGPSFGQSLVTFKFGDYVIFELNPATSVMAKSGKKDATFVNTVVAPFYI